MKPCPNCQTANATEARFCLQCGHRLATVEVGSCAHCGTPLPHEARYCTSCGHPIAGHAANTQLEQYIPRALLDKLNTARTTQTMAGERRVVTMLFCDIKGSTAMAETLDPEEWADIMNGAFEHLIAPVYQYEGTLARLMGDAILAFFGAPIAHEDDPQRAILAGLDIVESIKPYREEVLRRFGLDFDVRVGINTGLVVVGEVGSDLRVEYTAMGDAINLAARMEQTAESGTVQISEDTYKHVAPLFEFDELGAVEVKGKRQPVRTFRPLRPKAEPGRVRGIVGLDAPLIGRQRELEALTDALKTVSQAERSRVACLVGDAGLGKSRLLEETRRVWEDTVPEGYWSVSRGVSYDTSRPYGQFQQHIRSLCGVNESDDLHAVRGKIAGVVGQALATSPPSTIARAVRAFQILLSAHPDGGDAPPEGEALKQELLEVMGHFWLEWASARPTALVFDDLHWADPASVELVQYLMDLIDDVPLLLMAAFRPDAQAASWGLKQAVEGTLATRATEISLSPLTVEEGAALVGGLLHMDALPADLRDQVLSKAEGNPFFVEEMVRALIDAGALVRATGNGHWMVPGTETEITVPDNLRGLLMARIDRLPEEARQALQLAAVIGRTFSLRVLEAITDGSELAQPLATLVRAGMIREASGETERTFAFHHGLTQEAAYDSILLKHRRVLHRKTGESLERLFPDRVEEFSPLLGQHFFAADDDAKAQHYYTIAGNAAARLYANAEAVSHYTRALEIVRREQPERVTRDALLKLYSNLGLALRNVNRYDDSLATYEKMEALGRERDDREMMLESLMARATMYATPTPVRDATLGETLSEQALELARSFEDQKAESRILWNLLLLHVYTGDFRKAVEAGEASLALARELDSPEQLAFTLSDIQRAYIGIGRLDSAAEVLDESRALWRKQDNKGMLSDNLTGSAHLLSLTGDFELALSRASEAYQVSTEANSLWGQAFSRIVSSRVYFELGDMGQAIAHKRDSMRMCEQARFKHPLITVRADLGWALASLGELESGRALARLALAEADEHAPLLFTDWAVGLLARLEIRMGDLQTADSTLARAPGSGEAQGPFSLAPIIVPLAEGELALARSDYDSAVQVMDAFLAQLESWGVRSHRADALIVKGRALYKAGQHEAARDALTEAREAAQSIGARWALWHVLLAQLELEAAQGNRSAARRIRDEARELRDALAASLDDPELQASFLALPHVGQLLASQ